MDGRTSSLSIKAMLLPPLALNGCIHCHESWQCVVSISLSLAGIILTSSIFYLSKMKVIILLKKTPHGHITTVVTNAPIPAEIEILIKETSVKMSEKKDINNGCSITACYNLYSWLAFGNQTRQCHLSQPKTECIMNKTPAIPFGLFKYTLPYYSKLSMCIHDTATLQTSVITWHYLNRH